MNIFAADILLLKLCILPRSIKENGELYIGAEYARSLHISNIKQSFYAMDLVD